MDGLCNSMETANGSDPNDICDPNGADSTVTGCVTNWRF